MGDIIKIPVEKHTEIVAAAKHILSLARSGKILAVGYAVLLLDDDGDVSSGTNAVWADQSQLRDGLSKSLETLKVRIDSSAPKKSKLIIQ
jgi:hypothetical protein